MRSIEEQLILHEGMRLKPYYCTADKLTIGVGRNLEDRGITEQEARMMLRNDIAEIGEWVKRFDWYSKLNNVRKKVIIDMVFNLGKRGFLSFQRTIGHIEEGDYTAAADEMLHSRWAEQVGQRAERLSKMMLTGKDY